MERIILEVDSATAQAWRKISPELKRSIEELFQIRLRTLTKKDQEASFEKLLDEARKEAAENGLTEEILEQLLNED